MTYEHIKRWTMPRDDAGETWPDYYSAGVGQSRDSDCLEASNFAAMLKAIGGESETVIVVRDKAMVQTAIRTGFMGAAVVDGDESDLRYLDPQGVVVGLYAKGRAKRDASGFVRDLAA